MPSYLLSALFAIILVASVVPIADQAVRQGERAVRIHAVASQGHQIIEATDAYVKANYGALLTSTAGGPQTIPLSALVTTGYLPPSTSAIDAYGQTWEISFYQPAAQDLEVLIHTMGGNPIPAVDLPEAAAEMGARGGLQPNATGPYASDRGDAIGAYGGWKVPVTQFGVTANPGSPADLLYYNSGTLSSTYLYRVAVPGEPQVNTMQTNLNAGANNITNTGVVQFTTSPASGVVSQGSACPSTGAIATNSDGSGQLMVCQGGVWTSSAGNPWDAYNGQSATWYDGAFPGGYFYIAQTVTNGIPYVTLADSCGTWSGAWGVQGAVYEPGGLEGGSYDGFNGCQPAAVKATLSGVVASSMFSWRTRSTGGAFPGFDIFIPWQGQPGGWVLYP